MPDCVKLDNHGLSKLASYLKKTARQILDENGIEAVDVGELALCLGVSPVTVYSFYASNEHILADLAADGFQELADSFAIAIREPDALIGLAQAYVDFALRKPNLFRLMFSPLLKKRASHPALDKASGLVFRCLEAAQVLDGLDPARAAAAWGLLHGLSSLVMDGLMPEDCARPLAEDLVGRAAGRGRAPRPAPAGRA